MVTKQLQMIKTRLFGEETKTHTRPSAEPKGKNEGKKPIGYAKTTASVRDTAPGFPPEKHTPRSPYCDGAVRVARRDLPVYGSATNGPRWFYKPTRAYCFPG